MNLLAKLFGKRWVFNFIGTNLPKNIDPKNYYTKTIICNNCGEYLPVLIKKGIYVSYTISSIICPNCGCKINKGA